ncbi:sh3-domain-containing protein [Stemphylium lycopersici]|uniref:Sh3-domain-containing protein n=1 Tax=Stemphylium lycopersici TaxID=183478 RepID=A0A364N239_STELY|nr:sh3-domain-containing protein [Stemphylium lycopersici]RAR01341.1 sh3-domain-containing protein [Stemphylium lycopersici]RAR09970.1 sh3-domain-containing protein [Stemphylium lycopersici]
MTRPHIIRADTIDLQDKTSPTAQDHSQQPERPAPLGIGPAAPHQQAAIRHVEQERSSEESRLHDAWSDAGTTLRDDPGSDDERTVVNHANGKKDEDGGDGDDGDMQDADVEEDMDDDMMDKISSSPSIDDGGYSLPCYPPTWPARHESLTPQSSPLQSTLASSSSSSSFSSPFTTTPAHFPISVADARRPLSVPASDSSPLSTMRPTSIPVSFQFSPYMDTEPTEHHLGEYGWTRTTNAPDHEHDTDTEVGMSPRTRHLEAVQRRIQMLRDDSQASLISELDEEQVRSTLKPISRALLEISDDPFVECTPDLLQAANRSPSPNTNYPEDEEDSWTTDSDADSWDEDLNQDNDDASNDFSFSKHSRFIDSGWGGECLRETEDIDFEFVYALHTFVATVEGQANATKGDTMVLLDDSNSYWWLVRVSKDNSIGYLPAEHIETPTERLARLNKHRNIDLSATMLGDTAEKSKNPLKKAMRRRNAKTVQFAPPTYVEASDYDYSSDEGEGELFGGPEPKQLQQQQQAAIQNGDSAQDENLQVQPLKVNGVKKDANGQVEGDARSSTEDSGRHEDGQRASDDSVDRPLDPKVSRNGTLRNTDSFFKDENTETRKITLTPNILRDDSSTSTTGSRERGPSLESLEKNGFADKVKEDKKKKEKKSGMLSGLFKRKDKRGKGPQDSMDSDIEKPEETDRSSPQSKPSDELAERSSAEQTAVAAAAPAPLRQSSKGKLQKSQRSRDDSPQKTKGILKTESPMEMDMDDELDAADDEPSAQQTTSSMRIVPPEQDEASKPSVEEQTTSPVSATTSTSSKNPFSTMMKPQQDGDVKREKVTKAKQRVQLDDFDSDESSDPFADPDAERKSGEAEKSDPVGRLSESPVHVSAADAQPSQKENGADRDREFEPHHTPGLSTDSSSQDTSSPISTPTPDDSPTKATSENTTSSRSQPENASPTHLVSDSTIPPPSRPAPNPTKDSEPSPPVSSESAMLPAWSDASLRAYLDDGSEIRDMLVVINDTTGVVPVGPDHPLMKDYLAEETKTMQGLSGELDRLLNGLMEKTMKRAGSGASKTSTTRSTSANGHLSAGSRF